MAWNEQPSPGGNTLLGAGVGLLWQPPHLSMRLDVGLPLGAQVSQRRQGFQENGIYYSIQYRPF